MALAFVPAADEKLARVKSAKSMADKKSQYVIDHDPEKQRQIAAVARRFLARQMNSNMVREGLVESVDDDETPSSGPVLRVHSDTCNQRMANAIAANCGSQWIRSMVTILANPSWEQSTAVRDRCSPF